MSGAAQVEVAVLEPHLLAHRRRVVLLDRERQRRRPREHLDVGRPSPRSRRWPGSGSRCPPGARSTSPVTRRQNSLRSGCGDLLVADDDLADPAGVTQVEEGHSAVVATAGDPAGQGDGLSDVVGAQSSRRRACGSPGRAPSGFVIEMRGRRSSLGRRPAVRRRLGSGPRLRMSLTWSARRRRRPGTRRTVCRAARRSRICLPYFAPARRTSVGDARERRARAMASLRRGSPRRQARPARRTAQPGRAEQAPSTSGSHQSDDAERDPDTGDRSIAVGRASASYRPPPQIEPRYS